MAINTSVTLEPHFEQFVGQQVAAGYYGAVSEAIRPGLQFLKEKEVREGCQKFPTGSHCDQLCWHGSNHARISAWIEDLRALPAASGQVGSTES